MKGLRVAETRCASEQVPYATTTLAKRVAEANTGLKGIKLTGDGVGRATREAIHYLACIASMSACEGR